MKWNHVCSLAWLKARQDCLTATDIKDLLPVTKTGKPRKVDDENYLRVLSRKYCAIDEEDCISSGWAARGHVLEPYAIQTFDGTPSFQTYFGKKLYHVDDVVLVRQGHHWGELGFSPDALDVQIGDELPIMAFDDDITFIGEVKCYAPEKHLICGCTEKDKLEERWQLAAAMAVGTTISDAALIFYNPGMKQQMFVHHYTRNDLANEIGIVLQIEEDWLDFIDNRFKAIDSGAQILLGKNTDERALVNLIMLKEKLNPDGEKSVML